MTPRSLPIAVLAALLTPLLAVSTAQAHFGLLLPAAALVEDGPTTLRLQAAFVHPFEQTGMPLARPASLDHHQPQADGRYRTISLLDSAEAERYLDHEAYAVDVAIERPGTHVFTMQPQPYWEPAEDAFIVHHTKTYVGAFGDESGWDQPLGLAAEIVPLTRPFGLWAGNVFQGQVLFDGTPLAHAEIEVEFLNQGQDPVIAPADAFITQTLRADANGVFSYAAPAAGWWGFAALHESDETIEHDGAAKAVEVGAVLWVHFESWPR